MENNHFNRNFDVDGMLNDTAKWLGEQVDLSTREFIEIAEQLDLRQEDWNVFWKMIRAVESRVEDKTEGEIEIFIGTREEYISEKQFDALRMALGEPEEESNCCGVGVENHNANDHTSICSFCGDGCGIVYVF